MEGINPREPTRAAAASLAQMSAAKTLQHLPYSRENIAVEIGGNHDVENPDNDFSIVISVGLNAHTLVHGKGWTWSGEFITEITDIPVDSAVNKLLCNRHSVVLSIHRRKGWNSANSFTEEAVGNRENVGLVDDGEVLSRG